MTKITALCLLLSTLMAVQGLNLGLCSTSNSGSSFDKVSYEWMSIGYCRTQCTNDGYNYAIVQSYSCWCSNDLPSSSVDSSNCAQECPEYSPENCAKSGYYGYLDVNSPDSELTVSSSSSSTSKTTSSSTSSTSSSSSTSSTSSTSSKSSKSSTTTSSSSSSTSTASSSSSSSSRSTLAPSSSAPSSTWLSVSAAATEPSASSLSSEETSSASLTEELTITSTEDDSSITSFSAPTTAYSTKTVDGSQTVLIKTEFVTALPTSSESPIAASEPTQSPKENKNSFFDSKGKVAGTFTAVGIVVVGIVAGLLYCCCCFGGKGKNDDFTDEENQYSSDESIKKTPILGSSTHSLKRDNSSKSIFNMLGKESVGGLSRSLSKKKLTSQKDLQLEFSEIQMFPITEFESNRQDARLDPLFMNNNISNQTLGDNIDYSRKLKIMNPDDSESKLSHH